MLAVAVAAAGCGRKADPLPPVVRVAAATDDLTVEQREETAVLRWSYPAMTTVGGPLPDLESVEVWRAVLPAAQEPRGESSRAREDRLRLLAARGEVRRTLDLSGLDAATRGPSLVVVEDLSEVDPGGGEVVWYAVRSRCCGNRPSAFSNIARLAPGEPPPPPTDLAAEASEEGIRLAWSPSDELPIEVERSQEGTVWTTVTPDPLSGGEWLDTGAVQGTTWRYRLRSVRPRGEESPVVGPATEPVVVAHPDIYPPEPPLDLVCLPEGDRVLLRWRAGEEAVRYRVERRVGEEPATVVADAVTGLGVTDGQPPLGTVTYAVMAVDGAGNPSPPVTCTAVVGGLPP